MTEREWIDLVEKQQFFQLLPATASNRKARLFGCSMIRRNWHLLPDDRCRTALEVSERYADSKATNVELLEANSECNEVTTNPFVPDRELYQAVRAWWASCEERHHNITAAVWGIGEDLPVAYRIHLDIFGNLYHPVRIDPRWLTSTVLDLANLIYNERQFERMPILADALMDAGCDSEEIIKHCQGPGPHVRGCWVVDLLTGRA